METPERRRLKAVAYERDGFWFAVLLDHHMMTYANSQEDLPRKIVEMLLGHIVACDEQGVVPFDNLPRAPERYWALRRREQEIESIEPPGRVFTPIFPSVELSWSR